MFRAPISLRQRCGSPSDPHQGRGAQREWTEPRNTAAQGDGRLKRITVPREARHQFQPQPQCLDQFRAQVIAGGSGIEHALLGSVTEKVVRKSPCPVLTVRHPEHDFVMP